ncbi:MAG: PilN domain-containing protein [Planctomycetota bacterium]
MTMNASFLPEDYLARKMARRSNIVCVSLFAVVLTGVMATYFVKQRQLNVAADENARVNAQVDAEATKIDQATKLQKQHQEMILRGAITSALVDPVDKSNVLAELINHMPTALSLTELELETEVVRDKKPAASAMDRAATAKERAKKLKAEKDSTPRIEIPETKVVMTMTGVAPTDVEVSEYMSALSDHVLFEDVVLVFSEQHKLHDTQLRKFKIELNLARGLTMAELQPTRVSRELLNDPIGEDMQITPQGAMAY